MKINIKEIGNNSVLAGTDNGRRVLAKLLALAGQEPGAVETLYLDFGQVKVATASFLREAVFGFRDAVRRRKSNYYPLIANAEPLVLDELAVLVKALGEVLPVCTLDDSGAAEDLRLIGELEPKQKITFDLVTARGECDAAELMREQADSVGQTAWNNRLAGLAGLGLLVELSQGRSKRYKTLLARS
jgi:hypothetical protein